MERLLSSCGDFYWSEATNLCDNVHCYKDTNCASGCCRGGMCSSALCSGADSADLTWLWIALIVVGLMVCFCTCAVKAKRYKDERDLL